MELENIPSKIFCKFITYLPEEYQVDDAEIEIASSSNHESLNQIISHLLSQEDLKFEFLVNGEFLRGNLKSHIIKHEINTEKTIEIQYSLSIQQPELENKIQQDDWISSLSSYEGNFVSGLFSGNISLYKNQKKVSQLSVSKKPIKTVKFIADQIFSGGLDQKIRVNRVVKNLLEPDFILDGAESSVQTLDLNPIDPRFVCAGTQDHSLLIWKIPNQIKQDEEVVPKKKIKSDYKPVEMLATNRYHTDVVSIAKWAETDFIVTGSQDHTVKFFDVNKKMESLSISLRDSVCSAMDVRNKNMVTGQENGVIKQAFNSRIWDLNQREKNAQKTLKSHQTWVSSVQFHPKSEFLYASSSYDETIKIWDMRCSYPLFTLKGSLKQFAVEWNGENQLLSGGQDKQISIHQFKQ